MYSPQFLARLRAYLASGGKEGFDGGIRGLVPTTMPVTPTRTLMASPAPGTSTPPPGYRYGVDPEFNYGFAAPVKFEKPKEEKKGAGGTISTGNKKADERIAAGDQRVIRNQEAAATYAAMDNARDGTPIPAHLQQRLDNRASSGDSNANRRADDRAAMSGTPGQYRNFWDRINGGGPGAGYTSLFDMINGGGMGGSYARPGTNIRGLGAVVRDLQLGGIGALARDAVDGRGFGASGDKFRGGKRALFLNAIRAKPAGQEGSIFNFIPESTPEAIEFLKTNRPEKDQEAAGTAGTAGTVAGQAAGGIVDSGVPVNFARGGIADIPDPAAEASPPMGNEKELISSAIAAIKGQVEDPRPILGAFLAKYGEEALRNLVDKVESGDVDKTAARSEGMLKGPGDGMDDRIPAKVEGGQDVLLANNEYIVPADVVSALGNGSSDAGAERMDKMLDRVRTAAHGKSTQQKKVSADKVLPA